MCESIIMNLNINYRTTEIGILLFDFSFDLHVPLDSSPQIQNNVFDIHQDIDSL